MNPAQSATIREMAKTYGVKADKEIAFTHRYNTYCLLRDVCTFLTVYDITDKREILEKAMGFLTEGAIHDPEPVKEFLVELIEVLAC